MRKLYTQSHDPEILKNLGNVESVFTTDEHAKAIEMEFGGSIYLSRENLLRHYMPNEFRKLPDLRLLINWLMKNNYKKIITFGAGPGIMEFFLKLTMPDDSVVLATDFDDFIVKKSTEFFPEVKHASFDFVNDDYKDFITTSKHVYEVAVFFGSMYVMEDEQIVKFLQNLRANGIRHVFDYHGGYINILDDLIYYLSCFKRKYLARKFIPKGKCHGFARHKREIRKLYLEAGYRVSEEHKGYYYRYIANLQLA